MAKSEKMNLSAKLGLDDVLHLLPNKRVLMRVDFNVPLKETTITDDTRIRATFPTIQAILNKKPQCLILMSHLGRPDGVRQEKSSLKPVADKLKELLGLNIVFLNDCVGDDVEKQCQSASNGQIILLENLRFHSEEEGQGIINGKKYTPSQQEIDKFRQSLTRLGEIFINDAFGTAHRPHSSMTGINLPVRAAGYLMNKEIISFSKALEKPQRPLLVILGGAKVKDKIKLIKNLLDLADELIIGGGMAFTFLKVLHNLNIGKSIFDEEGSHLVKEIMEKVFLLAEQKNVKIHLPIDFACGDKFHQTANVKIFDLKSGIDEGYGGYDAGPQTIKLNSQVIANAKTIVWNGPQGVSELGPFKAGSIQILNDLIKATQNGCVTLCGGGDTVALIQSIPGVEEKLTHVSTGGGASLELLEGNYLPGIKFLGEK